ncbi:unnamed protein product, partial [Phaeothamnion confervicola]
PTPLSCGCASCRSSPSLGRHFTGCPTSGRSQRSSRAVADSRLPAAPHGAGPAQDRRELAFEELAGKKVAVIFDGTTRTHEVFAVVAHIMDADGRLRQRLIEQAFYKAAFNARNVARVIIFKLTKWDVKYMMLPPS